MDNISLQKTKLIIGLGNIGKLYQNTRHNAGFIFLDTFLECLSAGDIWQNSSKLKCSFTEVSIPDVSSKIILIKPSTLMNLSGDAVSHVMKYFKVDISEIIVAHDDLDIALGKYKFQLGKGPKVHNGLESVNTFLKTDQYIRLRLGVENRKELGNKQIPGLRYVLERFPKNEFTLFKNVCTRITKNDLLNIES